MNTLRAIKSPIGFACLLAGTTVLPACGGSADEPTSTTSFAMTSGSEQVTPEGDPTSSSETATLVSKYGSTFRRVVAFNREDPLHENYDETTRWIFTGASLASWNYGDVGVANAFLAHPLQRLVPPAGWPVLWGDPGLGKIPGTSYVYMTTLAIPSSKWSGSHYGSLATYDEATGKYHSPIGGACVARSTDGGAHFSVSAADCLHTATYDFYDGSEVVGTSGNSVYAAFTNLDGGSTVRIDVYRATSATGAFTQLSNPFPGKAIMISGHPRMVADGATVYMIAPDASGNLWLTTHNGSAWSTPVLVGTGYDISSNSMMIGDQLIRRGAQYDLAVIPQYIAPTVVRVFYAKWNGTHAILKGSELRAGQISRDIYTIDPGRDVFHPAMANASVSAPVGTPGWRSVNIVTWLQENTNGTVSVYSSLPATTMTGVDESAPSGVNVCPDNRGYWGDYDAHLGIYQATPQSSPTFYRSFTDSSDRDGASSCIEQWDFYSAYMAISQRPITRYQ